MQLILQTWNDNNIQSTPYDSWIPVGQLVNLRARGVSVPRAGNFPKLSGTVLPDHFFTIGIKILETVVQANQIPVYREQLKQWFDVTDQTRHKLVAKDILDGDRLWYLQGFPVALIENSAGIYSVTLQIERPIWQTVSGGGDLWHITASEQTHNFIGIGNYATPPVIGITPKSAKSSGLQYRRWIPVYNNLDTAVEMPFDVTNGSFDTAALVAANKMQADGDDLLLWMDGDYTDRWLADMNTANTKVWMNLSLKPRQEAVLLQDLLGSEGYLEFEHTRQTTLFLQEMLKHEYFIILLDNEAFVCSGANIDLVNYAIWLAEGEAEGTTAGAHAPGATARWIEHSLWMLYGDDTLGTPDINDNLMPVLDMDASTNADWVWDKYFDNTAPRAAAWKGARLASKTGQSYVFTGDENSFENPSSVLGLALSGGKSDFDVFSAVGETGTLAWLLYHPIGFTGVVYGGKKYAYDLNGWPQVAGVQVLQDNMVWLTQDTWLVPTLAASWQVVAPITVTFGATYKNIRVAMDGSINPVVNNLAMIQVTLSASVDTTYLPTVDIGDEQDIAFLDHARIYNNTIGDFVQITTPCLIDDTVFIDCENRSAYVYSDRARVNAVRSYPRSYWLTLEPGTNEWQYDDAGTTGVDFVLSHYGLNI